MTRFLFVFYCFSIGSYFSFLLECLQLQRSSSRSPACTQSAQSSACSASDLVNQILVMFAGNIEERMIGSLYSSWLIAAPRHPQNSTYRGYTIKTGYIMKRGLRIANYLRRFVCILKDKIVIYEECGSPSPVVCPLSV